MQIYQKVDFVSVECLSNSIQQAMLANYFVVA